jgi:hypothetical protein
LIGHDGGNPVFIGHYWITCAPEFLSDKVACVDYSVAKGGKLAAYRWDAETFWTTANWTGRGHELIERSRGSASSPLRIAKLQLGDAKGCLTTGINS